MKNRVAAEAIMAIAVCLIVHAVVRGPFSTIWGGEALIPAYWGASMLVRL